jgi:hypothetical protein
MPDGLQIGSLFYDLTLNDKGLKGQLDDADGNVRSFSDKLQSGLNKAAAGFAVIGAGLTLVSKNATDFAVQAVKDAKSLGQQIGVSTEEASRLTAAFGRMGIEAGAASQMFGIFSKQIVKATQDAKDHGDAVEKTQIDIEKTRQSIAKTTDEISKNGDKSGELTLKLRELNNTLKTQLDSLNASSNAFQKLGISTLDAQGNQKDFNTLLFEVADRFKDMPNGIDKTALAMELFGRSGKDMIKVLNLGSDGIKDLEAQADKLGLTLTSSNIAAVNDYIQSQKDLKQSTDSLKIAIGTTTAPVLTEFNQKLNEIVLSLIQTDGPMKTVTVDFIAFAGPVFGAIGALAGFGSALVQIGEVISLATIGIVALLIVAIIAIGVAIVEAVMHMQELGMWVNQLTDWFTHGWGLALGLAVAAIMPLIGIPFMIIANWTTLQTFFVDLWQSIVRLFSGAYGWLYNAGRDIINGLVDGIKDRVSSAVNAVKSVGDAVIKAARVALQWHSPSRVFMEAGKSISQGLALGIQSASGLAMSAMDSLNSSVISPQMSLSGGGSAAPAGAQGPSNSFGDTVVNIGQVNNAQDEAFVLRKLDRSQQLEAAGMSPLQ